MKCTQVLGGGSGWKCSPNKQEDLSSGPHGTQGNAEQVNQHAYHSRLGYLKRDSWNMLASKTHAGKWALGLRERLTQRIKRVLRAREGDSQDGLQASNTQACACVCKHTHTPLIQMKRGKEVTQNPLVPATILRPPKAQLWEVGGQRDADQRAQRWIK